MNVGIIIPHRGGEELRTNFANAAEQGFHHAQLVSWDPRYWTEENAREVDALRKEFDIEITAFWCGWVGPKCWNFTEGPETLGLVPVAFRAERIQNILDGAAYAKRLGIADIVTHMGFIPENMTDPAWPGVVATVKYLAMCLKRSEQNLLFETGQETPVVLLRLFETVNTGNLFINLDPANLILYSKGNPVDALDVFGKYVRGVHAKGRPLSHQRLRTGRGSQGRRGQGQFPEVPAGTQGLRL